MGNLVKPTLKDILMSLFGGAFLLILIAVVIEAVKWNNSFKSDKKVYDVNLSDGGQLQIVYDDYGSPYIKIPKNSTIYIPFTDGLVNDSTLFSHKQK